MEKLADCSSFSEFVFRSVDASTQLVNDDMRNPERRFKKHVTLWTNALCSKGAPSIGIALVNVNQFRLAYREGVSCYKEMLRQSKEDWRRFVGDARGEVSTR